MTTQESEADVLAVMDKVPKVVDLASYHYGEWASAAQGCTYKPDSYVVDALAELRKARAAVAEVFEAVRPIADLAELFDDELRGGNMPKADSDPIMQWPRLHKEYELKVGHLRNLRTALRNAGVKP